MSSITFFFFFIVILAGVLLVINLVLAPHNPYQEKDSAFECGFHSFLGQNRTQFSISFFIFALLFLLFDIEILLVYPYITSSITNEMYGLIFLIIFFAALTAGFIFELGKDALKIPSRQDGNFVKLVTKHINHILYLTGVSKPHDFVTLPVKSSIELFILPFIFLIGILTSIFVNTYIIYTNLSFGNILLNINKFNLSYSRLKILSIYTISIILLSTLVNYNFISIMLITYIKNCMVITSIFFSVLILVCLMFNFIIKNVTQDTQLTNMHSNICSFLQLTKKNLGIIRIIFIITIGVSIFVKCYTDGVNYSVINNLYELYIFDVIFVSLTYIFSAITSTLESILRLEPWLFNPVNTNQGSSGSGGLGGSGAPGGPSGPGGSGDSSILASSNNSNSNTGYNNGNSNNGSSNGTNNFSRPLTEQEVLHTTREGLCNRIKSWNRHSSATNKGFSVVVENYLRLHCNPPVGEPTINENQYRASHRNYLNNRKATDDELAMTMADNMLPEVLSYYQNRQDSRPFRFDRPTLLSNTYRAARLLKLENRV